jgi:hypothetical protein
MPPTGGDEPRQVRILRDVDELPTRLQEQVADRIDRIDPAARRERAQSVADLALEILALDLSDELGTEDVVGTFSTSGTLAGRVADIDPDGVDIAVLVEGMTDSLAALLAFPTCAVVGANGCYNDASRGSRDRAAAGGCARLAPGRSR